MGAPRLSVFWGVCLFILGGFTTVQFNMLFTGFGSSMSNDAAAMHTTTTTTTTTTSLSLSEQSLRLVESVLLSNTKSNNSNIEVKQTSATTTINGQEIHNPTRFSNPHNLQPILQRGLNVINVYSGCQIASWVVAGCRRCRIEHYEDCESQPSAKHINSKKKAAASIKANDTIYVVTPVVPYFVKEILPAIQVDFVLLSGNFQNWQEPLPDDIVEKVMKNKHVIKWFSMEMERYLGRFVNHEKAAPFPLGLRPSRPRLGHFAPRKASKIPKRFMAIKHYRKAFLQSLGKSIAAASPNATKRTDLIFVSPMKPTTSDRKMIEFGVRRTPQMEMPRFYKMLTTRVYATSPKGVKNDCHRHYEVIGMGAIPITELDPATFRHLAGTPVVYNTSTWHIPTLRKTLTLHKNLTAFPVNRNMAFEEYYMEYVEREVNRPLRWWDVAQKKRLHLTDFKLHPATNSVIFHT